MDKLIYLVPIMGVIGLLYTFIKFNWVSKQDAGTDRMKEISNYIADGAMAFLKAEWKILTYFAVIVAIAAWFYGQPQRKFSLVYCNCLSYRCILQRTGRLYWYESCNKSQCSHRTCCPHKSYPKH